MSEYQYYEFLAIDRPLTTQEMDALRALSTRAHITPVSFANEYHWGDLKGDPLQWMKRFFDAHVYVANWATAVFMLRLPRNGFDPKAMHAFTVDGVLEIESTPTHRILIWSLEQSENYDRFGMEDGSGWMARLVPLREELLRGDLRSLYIGWLAGVSMGLVDKEELEPMALAGLGDLTPAQKALAEFLEVNEDLLAGAGLGAPADVAAEGEQEQIETWLALLPPEKTLDYVRQLVTGCGAQAERDAKGSYEAWLRLQRQEVHDSPLRTVEDLWTQAGDAKEIRLEQQKHQAQRLAARRQQEREAHLESLARDFPQAWGVARQQAERGSGKGYDEACKSLLELSEAYSKHASREAFEKELRRFMASHSKRKALVERLVKAGLWRSL